MNHYDDQKINSVKYIFGEQRFRLKFTCIIHMFPSNVLESKETSWHFGGIHLYPKYCIIRIYLKRPATH